MTTLVLSHPDCLGHESGHGHPERPDRLRAIDKVLAHETFDALAREAAPEAPLEALYRVHPERYVGAIHDAVPTEGLKRLDPDTAVSPGSWRAALRAAGAGIRAVDAVMAGTASNVFCAVRPPGHHAEASRAMGFCLFNNVAIAAFHARAAHGAGRVAVVDFDVHHGNGTQAIFSQDEDLFYASSHQMPHFPGTGSVEERGTHGNIVNAPLASGDGGTAFRAAWEGRILPALEAFAPDLLLVSAGFDGHRDDPLAGLMLVEADYAWVTRALVGVAARCCGGRMVSLLEGGYDLTGLGKSVGVHVAALMGA